MILKRQILRPTNKRVRVFVGLLLAGLFCVQCTRTEGLRESHRVSVISGQTLGENAPEVTRKVEELARTDHIALLEYCLKNYEGKYRDYTCTFIKQERIRGEMKDKQHIAVKFLGKPFSVAMAWVKNAPIGDRVIYVDGKYRNQMLVRPRGFLAIFGTQKRPPDGADAMKNTLRPVNKFGFKRGMISLLEVYRQAKRDGDLKEEFGEYAEVDGRKTVCLIRYLPPKNDYPAHKTVTYLDLEYLVPIRIEGYDWDGNLSCEYTYKDVKFNVGLNKDAFLPEANGMTPPK